MYKFFLKEVTVINRDINNLRNDIQRYGKTKIIKYNDWKKRHFMLPHDYIEKVT